MMAVTPPLLAQAGKDYLRGPRGKVCQLEAGCQAAGAGARRGCAGSAAPAMRRRSCSSDAMTMPVVVRPRPIWQLNTSAAPSGESPSRAWTTSTREGYKT